jgi:cytochrome c peroxidase
MRIKKIKGKLKKKKIAGLLAIALSLTLLGGTGWAQSLKTIPVPEPFTLFDYVVDKNAAIALGKALFWDMQVGSDGVQSCASCHFHAGADNRNRNQINPGMLGGSSTFTPPDRPNSTLTLANFPFHKLSNPDDANSPLVRPDNHDVASSQGIRLAEFVDIKLGSAVDISSPLRDPIFRLIPRGAYVNTRRVEPRNTPSVINSVFNFANFWDGRANNIFNGVNPFGPADPNAKIFVNNVGVLTPTAVRIADASLASQAVGPPLSDFEMSFRGRTWPKIGKKMLSLPPLAKQAVHPRDSVLGIPLSKSTIIGGNITFIKGLNTTYEALIQAAFQPQFWNNTTQMVTYAPDGTPTISPRPPGPLTTDQFTQMEANFSLFFGLAVQLYEATLIADDSPFDRFLDGFLTNLTQQQQRGLATFQAVGCITCHAVPETTEAASRLILAGAPPFPFTPPLGAIEIMLTANRQPAFYDKGWFNIAVVPTAADLGRGFTAPFTNPLVPASQYPLSYSRLGLLKRDALLPPAYAAFIPVMPIGTAVPPDRTAINGSFKAPQLRNVELTGPYFHNGGAATLRQVVDFYTRGGNFADNNLVDLDPLIAPIGELLGLPSEKNEVVALMLGMTDNRVKNEMDPFDHPELFVPHGTNTSGKDIFFRVPPVGRDGRSAEGLPPLQSFLNANHFTP